MTQQQPLESMVQNWTEMQKRVWDGWISNMERFSGAQGSQAWTETLRSWETSVNQTIEAQSTWVRQWFTSMLANKETSAQMKQQLQQGQSVLESWINNERQLWQGWFNVVRTFTPFMSGNPVGGQQMMQAWQEVIHKGMETQRQLMEQWTTSMGSGQK